MIRCSPIVQLRFWTAVMNVIAIVKNLVIAQKLQSLRPLLASTGRNPQAPSKHSFRCRPAGPVGSCGRRLGRRALESCKWAAVWLMSQSCCHQPGRDSGRRARDCMGPLPIFSHRCPSGRFPSDVWMARCPRLPSGWASRYGSLRRRGGFPIAAPVKSAWWRCRRDGSVGVMG